MKTTAAVASALTIAAIAAAPGIASAAGSSCPQGEQGRIAVNHSEVLVTSA